MALCPFAKQLLIPPGANDPKITARAVVLHVDAGNASSLYDFFKSRSGGLESHFFVKADGGIEQYRDTAYQADAAFASNDFAIQVETQGYGDGSWTTQQIAAIQRLLVWCHNHHGIPLKKIESAYGSGIGYHSQWPSWNQSAHSCPGPNRIRQFENTLVPWMAAWKPVGAKRAQLRELAAKLAAATKRVANLKALIERVKKS